MLREKVRSTRKWRVYIMEQIWPELTMKIIISSSFILLFDVKSQKRLFVSREWNELTGNWEVSRGWPNGRFDLEFIDLPPLHFWSRNSYIPAWFSCPDLTQRDIAISFRIGLALTYPPTYGRIRTKRRWRISPSMDRRQNMFQAGCQTLLFTCKTTAYRNHSYKTIRFLQYNWTRRNTRTLF